MAGKFDLTIRVGGEGGEGVMSAGELTALGFVRLGMNVYTYRTNPPEIKGGPAMFQFRLSDGPVLSQGDAADFLLCFNQEAWILNGDSLREGGTLMYDPAECEPPAVTQAGRVIPLPLTQIAKDEVGSARAKNVVAVGVMAAFAGMPMSNMEELVRLKWGKRRAEVLDSNLKGLALGYEYVRQHITEHEEMRLPVIEKTEDRIIMSGNDAAAFGALAGGLECFFGYPITPATDIMEWLAKRLPMVGGTVVQTEDEIAAITACCGASFAGAKVATSSSGPGVSLMVEGLGLAVMEELPLVVFDAMRAGPSTGMPTKTEQGDINLAILAAHGDAPRIVVGPKDVESCFYTAVDALNLAEKYQTPVIYLTDQTLSTRTQTFRTPDATKLQIVSRRRPAMIETDEAPDYKRYELSPDHISPMAIPGRDNLPYVATGLEHNEHAHIDQTPAGHTIMSDKRARKIESAAQEPGWTEELGDQKADIGILCWGSTAGPAREALEILQERGVSAKMLFVRMLWPMREAEIRKFITGCRAIVLPELNGSGQYAQLVRSRLYGTSNVPIVRYNKVTGLPFGAHEIADFVEEVSVQYKASSMQVSATMLHSES
ncbi:MAG TPA: 2-oxoacid:acceptor oxidoreductase subunit alpha [Armatimonadota bacterium]|jgi:2-oxoglutarate ferredoxin oxidoreductase subunit alpha